MKKLMLILLLFACTKEAPEPEFEYSVFSQVEIISSIFDEIGVTDVRALVYTQQDEEDIIMVERIAIVDLECPKISLSGNVIDYRYPLTVKLWADIYVRFEAQDGWVYLPTLSNGSLQYIDIELKLGLIDSEFRMSRVISSAIIRSTNTNKKPILEWIVPKIEIQ